MFDEELMLFRLDGLWQTILLEQFPKEKYEDIEDIHKIKDKDYDPDEFGEIVAEIHIPQGSLKECAYYLEEHDVKKGDICPYFKEGKCDMYDYFKDKHHGGFLPICGYSTKDGKWGVFNGYNK